jgi:integrase
MSDIQTSEPPAAPAPVTKRKGFRLFKLDSNSCLLSPENSGWREAHYSFQFQFRGKTYKRRLETNDASEAQKRARAKAAEIREAVVREEFGRVAATKLRAPVAATVAEICEAYETAPGDASKATRRQNVNALHQLLRTAHPDGSIESLSGREINAGLVQKWFRFAMERAEASGDQLAEASIKKSANSRFVQASSLFTERARAFYASKSIDLDGFGEFVKAGHVHRFTRLPKDQYNPPAEAIIKATLEAWQLLEDRNLFLAVGHALAFGLRKSEIGQARWSWWTTRGGYPVLDGTAEVKNGSGLVQVRALDPWFNFMRQRVEAQTWRGKPEEFIITGNATFRTDDIFRAVSEWLTKLGWQTMKMTHALRAYAGSQVAMKYGIYEAQCWLRHSTVKVTEQHYTHFVKRFRPADVNALPATWAQLQEGPVLRLLSAPVA